MANKESGANSTDRDSAVDRWEEKNSPREHDPVSHKPERVPSGSVQSDPIAEQNADSEAHKANKSPKRAAPKKRAHS